MAQIAANPWLFTNADQASSVGVSSITNQTDSILVTTSAVHGFTNPGYQAISLQGTTNYNGPYRILAVPSTTTLLLKNQQKNYGAANGGAAGNVLSMAYIGNVRAEQIYWQPSAAAQTLLLTDGFGNTVWNPSSAQAGGVSLGPFSYGKIFWFQNGLVINTLPATGNVQITVN